jgi:hypothetical protein
MATRRIISKIEGFDEIEKKLATHPSKLIHDEWTNLKNTWVGIYQKNRQFLVAHLQEPSQNDELSTELMQNVRPPVIREQYTNEVLRHLYNYLSSLATLVDYSIRLTAKYEEEKDLGEFTAKKVALIDSGRNSFMGDLRNYIVHFGVPPLGWNIRLKNVGFNECTYRLGTAKLLEWDGWKQKSKTFIKSCGEFVDLKEAIVEHGKQIDEVFLLLLHQFPKLHSKDVAAYNELMHERNDILSGKKKAS